MAGTRLSLLAAAGICTAFGLSACKPKDDPDPRTADRIVETVRIESAATAEHVYTGVVAARVQSDLGFRVSGKIVERLVDTGQTVSKGQVLMRLDPTDYLHAVTTQIGGVASLHARWVQAAADERRYRGLVVTGAVAASAYDQVKAASDSARAQLDAALAQEKIARNQDDYSLLRADEDGVVVQTLAEPGHVVAAGQTVIVLAHAGPREAAVDLPEGVRPALHSAADAELYDGAFRVPSHLRQLSDAADASTRTFEARYVMDGAGAKAPLGATVRIRLPDTDMVSSAYVVPLSAIDDEGHGPGIWSVNDKSSTVGYHPVKLISLGEDTATIVPGVDLRPGMLIAAAGGHELHDGEHIRIASTKVAMQ
ncbi:efflux transporter protein [Neoasaia chiangmaiensis NBRC 101099]|uniref:Efflux transporter periplasmic adaptor subunit n=1 Tax=Neoasaia chiangmaiensis TaxID=320497 RepID=A0A1U9KQM1_9PROT|nr:efflux RND transporter periplasmic adaptor subunit [Neoasaia chiangmaiensis]AQS88144.1 efflux transporter periplasmic adaptor subunit [Neoasaia chiangmaiensis]GBR40014.1 efflux transporter protein [Neoasaia chiangmaiensis NBRC 101099]GEN14844.1 secretion protein HylD [Neoasaia chiangmaiensis]